MKVMGHRGAAGLALENTLNSFEMAKLLGVDFIELDIHKTADGELVVVHDNDLRRISNQSISIKNSSLKDIQKICLIDAQSVVPTLKQVINATEGVPLVIEIKSDGCVDELTKLLKKHKDRDIAIASFRHNELKLLRSKVPEVRIFGLERTKPIDIIQFAKSQKLDGIGLNYWLLNPLTYLLCRRYGLSLYVYTINNRLIGNILGTIYPNITICTDYPERFIKHTYDKIN